MPDKKPNRLINSTSPYLLLHSQNPVDWYPWTEEAFTKAKADQKPIFLSIGYSSCHYCHKMNQESFEDDQIAGILNQKFISIKVDREERPDIDHAYMLACQMMTGTGGWPLSMVLTPEGKPFFAGTYFPKESRDDSAGLLEILGNIADGWASKRAVILDSALKIEEAIKNAVKISPSDEEPLEAPDEAYNSLYREYDDIYGGFSSAPKFPGAQVLNFLMEYSVSAKEEAGLSMATGTLDAISRGGIYDQIGGGFHRYSRDQKWILPHFEKMASDQALLSATFLEAFRITGKDSYGEIARGTLNFVLSELSSENGFYSSVDSSTDGQEGRYYLWSYGEISGLLNEEEFDFAKSYYNIEEEGNTEEESMEGLNVLYIGANAQDEAPCLVSVKRKLLNARKRRREPAKDKKILTDINGLMISALSKAYGILKDQKYLSAAVGTANRILEESKTGLRHVSGQESLNVFLDDYAFFIRGLLDLHEVSGENKYYNEASLLNAEMIKGFWDFDEGGFFFTPKDSSEPYSRQKLLYDGALPSGNSVGLEIQDRLFRKSGIEGYSQMCSRMKILFSETIMKDPASYCHFLISMRRH